MEVPEVKIKRTDHSELALLEKSLPQTQPPVCFFPQTIEKAKPKTVLVRRLQIKYSSIKMNASAQMIRKRHIYDAVASVANGVKKGAKIVLQALENGKSIARRQGLAEERLYVKECIVGRALGQVKMDIRARGKFGMIHAPICSLRIVLEEKPMEDFFKMVISGKTP